MSLLRVPVQGLSAGVIELEPSAARYVTRVNRLRIGDSLVLFDPEARLEAEAAVIRIDRKTVSCDVTCVRPATRIASRPLWLLQGVSKGERFDQVVRDATALGATDIVPVAFERCDVVLSDGSEARRRRWSKISIEASRQCGRGDIPVLHPFVDAARAISMVPERAVRLCFWELATVPMRELTDEMARSESVALMIGPEGGLEESEVQMARASRFHEVSLGPFILRTETATTAALGAVSVMTQ